MEKEREKEKKTNKINFVQEKWAFNPHLALVTATKDVKGLRKASRKPDEGPGAAAREGAV
jgi:hypothetical protein